MSKQIAKHRERLTRGFARALGIEAPGPELTSYVSEGRGELPPTGRLLAWDANSVHGYVFDTSNASAIRGASAVLATLDRKLRDGFEFGLHPGQILFAGGGGGLAVVSDEQAEGVIARIHELYARETLVATCSTATVPLGSGEVAFRQLFNDVRNELARDRVLRGSGVEPDVPFFAERCAVCGRRVAAVDQQRHNERRLECEVCQHTIERGKKDRDDETEVQDFEQLADPDHLAVLYFDGNGIGQHIAQLASPLDYAVFSGALDETVRRLFESLAEDYGLREEGRTGTEQGRGYQLPICGGDDLVAILPGDIAVPFARDLLTRFETVSAEDEVLPALQASAGVAIGKKKFPIRHLIEEAEELLKTAKKRVYRDEGTVRSALDFAEIADGSPRRASFQPERLDDGRQDLLLSGRPYSLPELERFSRRFRTVRAAQLGHSQLYAVRRFARQGLAQLRNHALYQVGRHAAWRDLIAQLSDDPGTVRNKEAVLDQVAPLYGGDRVLDIADMIELYDHWREPDEEART